jgi:hypothetical protein
MSSPTDRTPAQMREDASMWRRAGYPETAVGRYLDAADQIARLERELAELRVGPPAHLRGRFPDNGKPRKPVKRL